MGSSAGAVSRPLAASSRASLIVGSVPAQRIRMRVGCSTRRTRLFGHRGSLASVLVFAVVSAETEHAVELFVRREDAEAFLDEVRADEPETAELLRLEPVELDA